MMAALKIFRVAFLIISISYMSGLVSLVSSVCKNDENNFKKFIKECKKHTTYFLAEQESLQVALYYDANVEPDGSFIHSMCKARKFFKHVTFSFFVGITIQKSENGSLVCPEQDSNGKSCMYAFLDACASKLVPDFAEYVCCSYTNDVTSVQECFKKQCNNLDEFQSCQDLQHSTIKPDEILLENSKNAVAAFPQAKCVPFLGFNGQTEECARNIFLDNPVKVICAMLAKGVEEECNK